jgi:uncharacterized protein YggE
MNDTEYNGGVLQSPRVAKFAVIFLGALIAFVAIQILNGIQMLNESPNGQQNVITVSGEGKVSAVPDIATINFAVTEDATTAAAAQDAAAKKINAALAVLKDQKIDDKDVQTSSYNVYPRYSNVSPCPAYNSYGDVPPCYPGNGEQKVIGYTASQDVTVKIRNVDSVGTIVTALGGTGISNINGPSFTVDNPDALQAEARDKAIADARTKANDLAKALGVRIVRVAQFSEGGGGYPVPMYSMAGGAVAKDAATVPSIPTGQNEIDVTVSITYEIR